MDEIIYILIIIGLGIWIFWLLEQKKENEKEVLALGKEKDELAELGKGLEEYNRKMQEKKEKAKEKIMELFSKKEKVSHKDVVVALNASKNTAVRYLDELEMESKIKQIGKTGQGVFYIKV